MNKGRPEKVERTPHTARGVAQHQTLIEIAFHLIAEGGFEGLRTRDVAHRAGINVATLHYYFPTKEDLIQGVVDYLIDHFMSLHPPYDLTGPDAPLEALQQEFKDVYTDDRQANEAQIVFMEISLRSYRDPAVKQILLASDIHWQEHIASYLADGVRLGVFRPDLDPSVAAQGVIAIIKGFMLQSLLRGEDFPLDTISGEIVRWFMAQTATITAET